MRIRSFHLLNPDNNMANILVVDDEMSFRKGMVYALQRSGHEIAETDNIREGELALQRAPFDLLVLDLCVPTETDGLTMLRTARRLVPGIPVLVVSAHGTIERAVDATKAGADDFIAKGFTTDELEFRVARLLQARELRVANERLQSENIRLHNEVRQHHGFDTIIGRSDALSRALALLQRVTADADTTVLLQGESGTGKELFARAIHYNGPRQHKPFVVINCSTLPEHLLESELFGYEKGAFTGALKEKPGKLEIADTGTLFFDEIGEISPKVQVELLRFLQERKFERLGSNRMINVDVRIVAATNKNLPDEVKKGTFRSDLFYRLNVVPIEIPPLRERRGDLPLLIEHFTRSIAAEKNITLTLSPETYRILERHTWPGNVRELGNLMRRFAVISGSEPVLPAHLPAEFAQAEMQPARTAAVDHPSLKKACEEFEKAFILHYLQKHRWNITEVAQAIGERRDTLSRKIKRYKLKKD